MANLARAVVPSRERMSETPTFAGNPSQYLVDVAAWLER